MIPTVPAIAHSIAKGGWAPVFLHGVSPDGRICSCRKGIECPSKGKHPIEDGWASKPRPSGADIQAMADAHPTANLGVRTGSISGIFVVDIDTNGLEEWSRLVSENGLPETLVVQTGSGLWHYYFALPEGVAVGSSRGSLPRGIDVRGDGGQVVCPPSRTDKGSYRPHNNAPPALPPAWLVEAILTPPRGDAIVDPGTEKAPTPEGAEKTTACLRKWTAELAALRDARWTEGAGWDETCWRRAQDFVALANSPWSPLTHGEAWRIFMEAAPRDAAWDQRQAKWDRAMVEKAGRVKDEPVSRDLVQDVLEASITPAVVSTPPPNPVGDGSDEGMIDGADDALETDSLVIAQFCNESLRGVAHFNPKWGWHVWTGKVWAECEIQVIEERFRLWVRSKVEEAARTNDSDKIKFYAKYLSGTRATGPVARCRGAMTIPGEVDPPFDRNPDLLTVGNGVLDLRTGTLLPFSPHYMLTKMTSVPYVPDARHKDWDATLDVLPPEVMDWMQLRLGQSLTGYPAWDDVVIFCTGTGSNGKSNLMVGATKALQGHSAWLSEQVLSAGSDQHTTYMTDLRGARLALLEETPEEYSLSTKRLKDIAGTPVIKARKMKQDNVAWPATHSLFVTTNHAPRVRATDHGTWRRLAQVDFPFRYSTPEDEGHLPGDRLADRGLRIRLERSPSGQHEAALAWLVQGAIRWYAMGGIDAPSDLPEQVRKDTFEWRRGADHVSAWIEERMEFDGSACVSSQEAFADFTAYLASQGAREWAENTFAERLGSSELAREKHLAKKRVIYRGEATAMSRRDHYAHQSYEIGQKVTVWTGLRFRREEDDRGTIGDVVDMASRR